MDRMKRSLLTGIASIALVAGAQSALAQAGNEWPTYGGDQANTRYSTLSQINKNNVQKLRVAWLHSLGTLESQESTPIVIGDTMYVTTSTGPRYVFALDAKTGVTKWKYEPEMPSDYLATVCCGLDNRGVARLADVKRLEAERDQLVVGEQRVFHENCRLLPAQLVDDTEDA